MAQIMATEATKESYRKQFYQEMVDRRVGLMNEIEVLRDRLSELIPVERAVGAAIESMEQADVPKMTTQSTRPHLG